MESKLYEECHEGGGFMAEQAMLKQDETVRTQIPVLLFLKSPIPLLVLLVLTVCQHAICVNFSPSSSFVVLSFSRINFTFIFLPMQPGIQYLNN